MEYSDDDTLEADTALEDVGEVDTDQAALFSNNNEMVIRREVIDEDDALLGIEDEIKSIRDGPSGDKEYQEDGSGCGEGGEDADNVGSGYELYADDDDDDCTRRVFENNDDFET